MMHIKCVDCVLMSIMNHISPIILLNDTPVIEIFVRLTSNVGWDGSKILIVYNR